MIGMLLITHQGVGQQMLDAATATFGQLPLSVAAHAVGKDDDPELSLAKARDSLNQLDQGNGVLILTDIYGSTPSNIAHALRHGHNVQVVTGLNLPMLFRVLNYAHLDLCQLTQKALSGGKEGILVREATVGESI